MNRIVVAHPRERVGESTLPLRVEIGPRREHAMIVGWRRPYLTKAAFGHQALAAHSVPEGAADRAGIGSPVEDRAHNFNFAGPGITMFAYVAVEAQRTIVSALAHALLLQEVNGQNSCVSAVSAAKGERPIFQIRESRNGTSRDGDDLCHPAEIGVAHSDRAARMAAPLIGLQVSKVCIPGDINTRHRIARLREERDDLRLIALKQNDLNGQMRFVVKVAPHPLPNRNHFRIVCNSSHPDCFAHRSPTFSVSCPGRLQLASELRVPTKSFTGASGRPCS